MAVNIVQNVDGSVSLKNEIDGREVLRSGGVPVGSTVNASASVDGTYAFRTTKWAIMPLVATAGVGAAIASFKNTEPNDVYITDYVIDIQTGSTASCTFSVGVGSLATSSSAILFSAMDLSSVTILSAGSDGVAGKKRAKLTTNQYCNMIMVSGSATGLVGRAMIGYVSVA